MNPGTNSRVIEIQALVKSFGQQTALAGASLFLCKGEILGLLGPNGAGKTTLVRAIMGRVLPDAGSIAVGGQSVRPGDSSGRTQIGWVTQELAIYPLLSARENLITFGRYQGLSGATMNAAVDKGLTWAALRDRAQEPVKNFSGGMKRRLNMAAGVIHRPQILLLDEPTVGVDPQSRERIYAMIEELHGEGVSILYTTHYMEEAERLCDRIAIIDHGRIIAEGTRDELLRATLGSAREAVIECAALPSSLHEKLLARGASVDGVIVRAPVKDSGADLTALLEEFRKQGAAIQNLAVKTPSLESVFLHLTGRELRE